MQRAVVKSSFRYAVLNLVAEEAPGSVTPIGVVLWSPESEWVGVRMAEQSERIGHLRPEADYPFIVLMRAKLDGWMQSKVLPYATETMQPHQTAWWEHVRKLLIHRIRLSEPRPIDCLNPGDELEPLYESIVGPYRRRREQHDRIDGQITKVLSDLSAKFKRKQDVPGFHDRKVRVSRCFEGQGGWVIIEGVNLASNQAERESDAVASRLGRVRAGIAQQSKPCEFLVGYLASPEGLNGEAALVEWIKEMTGARLFDLARQQNEFRQLAGDLVANVAFTKAQSEL